MNSFQSFPRKTTPRVKFGRVQRKNRAAPTPSFWNTTQAAPVIVRERPGSDYRHILLKRDIFDFISILPDWNELSNGLDAILLAQNSDSADGWHCPGVVAVCAWPRDLWIEPSQRYYSDHKDIFARLGVACERKNAKKWLCRFTEHQVRGYQLRHILLHELGHHHDRMSTKSKCASARGESFAEHYALEFEQVIWQEYLKKFELF